jgi:tRNA(fMet)-specific endonuclease VapC
VGTLVDSSVLIAVERGQLDPATLADEDDAEQLAMSAITASELLHGVHRLKSAVKRARASRFVESAIETISVVDFDLDIARIHAELDAELAAAGTSIGEADLMVAATAVWLDFRVATRDLRSFPKIKNLRVVRW